MLGWLRGKKAPEKDFSKFHRAMQKEVITDKFLKAAADDAVDRYFKDRTDPESPNYDPEFTFEVLMMASHWFDDEQMEKLANLFRISTKTPQESQTF